MNEIDPNILPISIDDDNNDDQEFSDFDEMRESADSFRMTY